VLVPIPNSYFLIPDALGTSVPAGPGVGLGTGSGTPSLREAKPDPMTAALLFGGRPDRYTADRGTVSPT